MNFERYTDVQVGLAATLVNELTAGCRQGREVALPEERVARASLVARVGLDYEARRRALKPAEVEEVFAVAARLREVFAASDRGDHDQAAAQVNALLADHRARPELSRHDDQPWHIHFNCDGPGGGAAELAAACGVALAMVVAAGDLARLGICTARQCDRVYVDTSRNCSRRFCSDRCHNRTKVAALRARNSASPAPPH